MSETTGCSDEVAPLGDLACGINTFLECCTDPRQDVFLPVAGVPDEALRLIEAGRLLFLVYQANRGGIANALTSFARAFEEYGRALLRLALAEAVTFDRAAAEGDRAI